MKLENIWSGLQDLKVRGTLEIEISKVDNDSRKIKGNDLFNKYADLLGCFLYFLYIAFGFIHFFTIFASE